ncbi:hypothetical protein Efla_001106 [Eimeria flavescens]
MDSKLDRRKIPEDKRFKEAVDGYDFDTIHRWQGSKATFAQLWKAIKHFLAAWFAQVTEHQVSYKLRKLEWRDAARQGDQERAGDVHDDPRQGSDRVPQAGRAKAREYPRAKTAAANARHTASKQGNESCAAARRRQGANEAHVGIAGEWDTFRTSLALKVSKSDSVPFPRSLSLYFAICTFKAASPTFAGGLSCRFWGWRQLRRFAEVSVPEKGFPERLDLEYSYGLTGSPTRCTGNPHHPVGTTSIQATQQLVQETLPNRLIRTRRPRKDNLDSGLLEPSARRQSAQALRAPASNLFPAFPDDREREDCEAEERHREGIRRGDAPGARSPRSPPRRPLSSPGEQGPLDATEVPRLRSSPPPGVSGNKGAPSSAEPSSQESVGEEPPDVNRWGIMAAEEGRFLTWSWEVLLPLLARTCDARGTRTSRELA